MEGELLSRSRCDDLWWIGGFEKGWNEVGSRYDWAASQFQVSGATKAVEYLSRGESGNLAFTVSIERSQVRTGAGAEESELALRVTQIFRKENGSWNFFIVTPIRWWRRGLLVRRAYVLLDRKGPSGKQMQRPPDVSFQSISGTVRAAGTPPQRRRSALSGAAEPPAR